MVDLGKSTNRNFCIYGQRVIIVNNTPMLVAEDYDSFKFYIPDEQNSDAN